MTDEQLVEQYVAGNPNAFVAIVERYQGKLARYLTNRLRGDQKLAEDVTRNVFTKVQEKIHAFDNSLNFKSWLYCITDNLGKDAFAQM